MKSKRFITYVFILVVSVACIVALSLFYRQQAPHKTQYTSGIGTQKISKLQIKGTKSNSHSLTIDQKLRESQVQSSSLITRLDVETDSNLSLAKIRALVDNSMVTIGGKYQGSQEIRDAQSNVKSYSLLYVIGVENESSSMKEIYDGVKNAEIKKKEGQRLLEEARTENDESKLKTAAKLLVQGDKDLTKEKDYVTVRIAATTDLPPILSFQYGLPGWVLMRDSAIEIAHNESGEDCVLKEIRQQGLLGLIFVAETESGQTLYIDPRQNKVFTEVRELVGTEKQREHRTPEEEERDSRISAQWKEFLEQGFDPKIFTLSDLTDLSKKRAGDEKILDH